MKCPGCGKENLEDASFCIKCGARLALVCPQCGTELPLDPDLRFCFKCGAQIEHPAEVDAAALATPVPGMAEGITERLERLVPKEFAERLLANLSKADLSKADLSTADLRGANLTGADLTEADLSTAIVTWEQLTHTKSLKGVLLPDGTKYPREAEPEPAPAKPEPQDTDAQPDEGSGLDAGQAPPKQSKRKLAGPNLPQRNRNPKTPRGSPSSPSNPATSTPTGAAMIEAVSDLAGLVLVWQKQKPWPQPRKEPPIIPTYCAWYLHRDGEDCTIQQAPSMGRAAGQCASVLSGAG